MATEPVIDSSDNPENNPVISGLARRRSEIAGRITHLEKMTAQSKCDLMHVDAVLALYGIDAPLKRIRTTRFGTAGLFHKGELPRLCADLIRKSKIGLTAKEIAKEVILEKGWGTEDIQFENAIIEKVVRLLGKLRKKGRFVSVRKGKVVLWKRVNKLSMEN